MSLSDLEFLPLFFLLLGEKKVGQTYRVDVESFTLCDSWVGGHL